MHLKHILRQVEPDRDYLRHDRPPLWIVADQPWHIDAVGGRLHHQRPLHVIDQDMADETRSTRSLSSGERFLISLSLALALSGLGGRGALSETLFIDEGFGSLDAASLDMAIDALEALQGQGRTIGIISHVGAMKDRIPNQIRVRPAGPGRSECNDPLKLSSCYKGERGNGPQEWRCGCGQAEISPRIFFMPACKNGSEWM
ncbi:SbcC/MukB-like Walker B domain-containing protein [Phaeovulum sp. W22_SRMD_FR3]|uniref:SbcC/MukB-like Walker B domain-containing protein n=1 Tax=Phaeovulum sp. W22_SRMD_FR3 TaxID=3240274 RepID=UPI003F950294